MSRYLAAANAKRLALARQLAQATAGVNPFSTSNDNLQGAGGDEEEDVDALIKASMAELGADLLPAENANLDDELGGLDIEGGPEDDDEVAKELERRKQAAAKRRTGGGADKIAQNKEKNKGGGVTAAMQNLNELALKRARAMVIKRFQTPLDLDDSSSVAYQMQKQSTASTAQLNGAVQTKLDALKRAADLMDESTSKLTKLAETIHDIDQRILLTNTVISNFEYLRRVHNVRDNVARVITNIDFFTKVPELVASLMNTLDTDPTQLKEVFLESIKLESLHSALIKELKTNKGRRASVAAIAEVGGDPSRSRGVSMYTESDEGQRRIIAAIEEHLGVVPDLSRRIREQLWGVLGSYDQIVDTASRSPQTLVATFEIVEMHQEYMDRRIEQAQRSGELEGMDPDFIATSLGYEAISDECQSRIRSAFENHVEATFLAVGNDSQLAQSKTATITTAATELVKGIAYFKHEVDPCFPPKYNALETLLDVFEEHLVPESQSIMRSIADLNTKETLRLIDWFHFYQLQVQELETGLRPSTEKFHQISEELMDEYINKVKAEIMRQFENVRQQFWEEAKSEKPNVHRHTDGSFCTAAPQDMYKILNSSLEVGAAKLPTEMLHKPILIALQCLQDYMRETYNLLEIDKIVEERADDKSIEAEELKLQAENMKKMSPDLMCAMVSDCSHSADEFKELGDKFISCVTDQNIQEALFQQLDEITNFFTDLAMHAVNFLSRCVMKNELHDSFCSIFSEHWENGEEPVVGMIADTINQVLEHSKENMEQFFYRKLANLLLTATVDCYLAALLNAGGNNPDTFRFVNEIEAAHRVFEDYSILREIFSKYEEDLTYGGLRGIPGSSKTPLEDALEPIAALQGVLQVGQFSQAEDHVKVLYERYPNDGLEIVRCAIVYRPEGSMRPTEKRAFERAAAEYCQRLDAVKNTEMGLAPPPTAEAEETPAKKGFFSRLFG